MNKDTFEIERKFLIKYPDVKLLKTKYNAVESHIEQIYLINPDECSSARIRKRVYSDKTEYTTTRKMRISDIKRVEEEKAITKEEYELLKKEADNNLMPIIKTRLVAEYENHFFEIDIYDFWKEVAVAEVELKSEDEEFEVPDFIEIIAELTYDRRFTNRSIAKNIPDISEYL